MEPFSAEELARIAAINSGNYPDAGPPPQTYTVVARSHNHKLGPIPATSRGQSTCPRDCPMYGQGCYAENRNGRPSPFDMVEKSLAGTPKRRLTMGDLVRRQWRKVPPAIRFNVSGDYLTPLGTPDHAYIAETNDLATSQPWVAWGYTHAWRRMVPSLFRYIVRASTETPEDIAAAVAAGWRTVVVDLPADDPETLIDTVVAGQRVIQCPVTNGKAASCADCRLCGRDLPIVIAFPVHGSRRGKAAAAIRAKRAAARAAAE